MPVETWYVMEDGSVGDPRWISYGADGKLVHNDGRKVAYAPHGPRSRGVDTGEVKDMKPAPAKSAYVTRDMDAGDLSSLRGEYATKFGKRAFYGWDADTLRAKIDAENE